MRASEPLGAGAESQDNATKVGEAVGAVVASMDAMTDKTKQVASDAEVRAKAAVEAVAAKMRSVTAEVKETASEIQGTVAKVRKRREGGIGRGEEGDGARPANRGC